MRDRSELPRYRTTSRPLHDTACAHSVLRLPDVMNDDLVKELHSKPYTTSRQTCGGIESGAVEYHWYGDALIRMYLAPISAERDGCATEYLVELYDTTNRKRIFHRRKYLFKHARDLFDRLVEYAHYAEEPIKFFRLIFNGRKYFK